MSAKPRVLFYFLHLLGVGHIYRAQRLIEGMVQNGIAVDVIYGGEPVEGVSFNAESVHYLSPIRAANNAYTHYLDENGNRLDKPYEQKRVQQVLAIFENLEPDAILVEAFPFGRRMIRHEMRALFDAAKQRTKKPVILSSVRDILQERKKPGRVEETRDWVLNEFDHVLVHSDPSIIDLGATYPLAGQIEDTLFYTGFVIPEPKAGTQADSHDVIVSIGGGAFGGDMLKIALQAAHKRPDLQWYFTTGPNLADDVVENLTRHCPANATIVRYIDNLAAHLKKTRLSISQCGYNTAMDVLAAHIDADSQCRAVFVPYDTEGQSEQLRRSQLLEQAGIAISLPQSKLTTDALLHAMNSALDLPKGNIKVDFNGVENAARFIKARLARP